MSAQGLGSLISSAARLRERGDGSRGSGPVGLLLTRRALLLLGLVNLAVLATAAYCLYADGLMLGTTRTQSGLALLAVSAPLSAAIYGLRRGGPGGGGDRRPTGRPPGCGGPSTGSPRRTESRPDRGRAAHSERNRSSARVAVRCGQAGEAILRSTPFETAVALLCGYRRAEAEGANRDVANVAKGDPATLRPFRAPRQPTPRGPANASAQSPPRWESRTSRNAAPCQRHRAGRAGSRPMAPLGPRGRLEADRPGQGPRVTDLGRDPPSKRPAAPGP